MDLQVMPAYLQVMHWDDLRFFLAVARAGQLARAAPGLGVDATTVARRLRRLELALAETLFQQTREGQVLTEAGERLLASAEEIERSMADINAGAAQHQSVSGLIRVSVSEGFGTWFVAHHLKTFLSEHREVHIDLVANSGFLSPSKRETDVAVLMARPRAGRLVSKKLSDYALGLYAARTYLSQAPSSLDRVEDLREHPLIGYIPDLIYDPALRYFGEILGGLEPTIRSSSINAQYRLAASGAGIAVLPCFIGDSDETLIRVLPDHSIKRSFWLVTHEDTRRLGRIEAFVEWITQTVRARRSHLLGTD